MLLLHSRKTQADVFVTPLGDSSLVSSVHAPVLLPASIVNMPLISVPLARSGACPRFARVPAVRRGEKGLPLPGTSILQASPFEPRVHLVLYSRQVP
jgi:hypothetical protein